MKQTLQKGDVVRCVDDGGHSKLSVGKQYDVLSSIYGNWIEIIDNSGEERVYVAELFEFCHIIPDSSQPYAESARRIVQEDNELFKDMEYKSSASNLPPGTEGKNKLDSKPHLAYFDPHLEYEMGMGMRQGALKHGWNNHRKLTADAAQQILDSVKRHLNNYLCGEEYDEETGVNHLACVVNNVNFLYRLNRVYGFDEVINNIYGTTK